MRWSGRGRRRVSAGVGCRAVCGVRCAGVGDRSSERRKWPAPRQPRPPLRLTIVAVAGTPLVRGSVVRHARVQDRGAGVGRRRQVRPHRPVRAGHLRRKVRPHHRGLLQEAGGSRRAAVHARDPRHRRHRTVHRHEGSLHEERARVRARLFDNRSVHLQRSARPPRADPPRQGHRRRSHGARRQQVRPGGRAGRRQGAGRCPRARLQLRLHGDVGEGEGQRQRHVLRPRAPDQQEVAREEAEAEKEARLRAALSTDALRTIVSNERLTLLPRCKSCIISPPPSRTARGSASTQLPFFKRPVRVRVS